MPRPAAGRQRGERTRAQILAAARKEFARCGYAGARIEAIAQRAGLNKSLIFYYFDSKEGLSRAVTDQRLATYALPRTEGDNLLDWPLWLFRRGEESVDAVHFLLTEGVSAEVSRTGLFEEQPRRASFQEQVERVCDAQRSGGLACDFDAAQLTFFLYVLGVYPYILPQGAYLIAGAPPHAAAFRASFEVFLGEVTRLLRLAPDTTLRLPTVRRPSPAELDSNGVVSQPGAPEQRDPTRQRILAAALKEFGLHGYRGARIETIARRARVPRGLIAYYFGTKEGLFRDVAIERAWSTERVQYQLGLDPDDPFAWSVGLFALGEPALDWVHMLIWEGLEWDRPGAGLLLEDPRREFWRRRIAAVAAHQAQARLPARMDVQQLTFFLWILGLYPQLVPQVANFITGRWPSDAQFRTDFECFVRAIAGRMQQVARVDAEAQGQHVQDNQADDHEQQFHAASLRRLD